MDIDRQVALARRLRELHTAPVLLELVNVWDVASARVVADTGAPALATASAAISACHGFDDGEGMPLALHLAAVGRICAAVDLPVTADLERGYGDVATTVSGALDAGAVGCNLEDDLCPVDEMAARVAAAVETGRQRGVPLVVNARTDVWLAPERAEVSEEERCGEAERRGAAYLAAGADCVFAIGCTDGASIARLAEVFGPGRLSLIARPGLPPRERLESLGVARLSHGPYAHRHTLDALARYAAGHDGE